MMTLGQKGLMTSADVAHHGGSSPNGASVSTYGLFLVYVKIVVN